MPIAYIKTADEAAWTALYRATLAQQDADGAWQPKPGVQIDVLGTVYRDTGTTTVVNGVTVPVMQASAGYHVNVIADDIPAALYPYLVNPVMPKRIMFGNAVLAMPETLPDLDTETVMVTRGVGATVGDDVLVPIAIARETARRDAETVQARRDLRSANLAVLTLRGQRQALVAQRDAEQAIRADAIAQLQTLTGPARAPQVARRDAAVAEIARLNPLIQAVTDDLAAARAARDAAKAALG